MKKRASFITTLLAVLLVFSTSLAVSAAPEPKSGGEAPVLSLNESTVSDSDGAEIPADDTPAVQGEIPDEAAPKKNGNTPFFVGAGIAVLIFAGVAVYCKTNGNKTY